MQIDEPFSYVAILAMFNFLDFIFPKRCVLCKKQGFYLCENCFSYLSFDVKSLCLLCNKPSYNGLTHPVCAKKYSIDGCFSALSYNKTTQKLIYNFKYKPFLTDLKTVLSELFYESIIQNENFNKQLQKGDWILVPIPLLLTKLRKRGYNQAEILARGLSKNLNLKTFNILEKSKDSFLIKKGFEIKEINIFLVDDIVKTGATLKKAAKVLKEFGAGKVFGLTLASK